MMEPVRLVVWDLDDTFWRGTLSETGISYSQFNHDIVVELANRGIICSICSKNDEQTVKQVLVEKGIWDYFVFSSIDWEAKGPRLAALVEAVQLRPATIMFIDDNHLNREEARFFVPDLQIADETIIPTLLSNPLFRGKDDHSLSRLNQYRMLAKRKVDEQLQIGSNLDFLRSCSIRVEIEFNVEAYLDRAIELINRTNQLNFTKQRLPEDAEDARRVLTAFLAKTGVMAGLVRVRDNYGDYGFCGFYAISDSIWMKHYCFSCRILNMQVETWLYRKLGRPNLTVKGEVLTNIFDTTQDIDWITQTAATAQISSAGVVEHAYDHLVAWGGCDLSAVLHYTSLLARETHSHTQTVRAGITLRPDHSSLLRAAIDGISDAQCDAVAALAYVSEDFKAPPGGKALWLLSFWGDAMVPLYEHLETKIRVPTHVHEFMSADVCSIPEPIFCAAVTDPAYRKMHGALREQFRCLGLIGEDSFKANLRAILTAADPDGTIAIILLNDWLPNPNGGTSVDARISSVNRWIVEEVAATPAVRLLPIRDFVRAESEIHAMNHFHRSVYHRLAQSLMA